MIPNNVLNDIADSGRLNVKYNQQIKVKLGNVKAQGIGLGANEMPPSENDFKYTSYEERIERQKIKTHYHYRKGGTRIDTSKVAINQHADTRIRGGRKCTPEHNIGTTTSKHEARLPEDIPQPIEQENRHFEDKRDWSRLSTSKICEILEDISSKKHRSKVHFTPLPKKEKLPKTHYKENDEGNQDWSQIPNEDVCELIEKIASRRNNSLKDMDRSCSRNQENSETIDFLENDTHIGELTNTLQRNAKGSCEKTTENHHNPESKISKAICLPHQEKELRLIPFLQKQRREPAIICRGGVREFRMRKSPKKLKLCPRTLVRNVFSVGVIISSHSLSFERKILMHQTFELRSLRDIRDRRTSSFLRSKLEQAHTEITSHLFKPSQSISPCFTMKVVKNRLGSKAFAIICHYELQTPQFDLRGPKTSDCNTHKKSSRLLLMPCEATAIKEIYHPDANLKSKTSHGNTVVETEKLFNNCLPRKGRADLLNSVERSSKSRPSEAKNNPSRNDAINVQGSVTANNSLFAGLRGLFHRLYSKDCWSKADLSETLFYDDLTNRWVKMGDLVQYH